MRVAPMLPMSNAVGKDWRILATLSSPASWFWPLGMTDPETGLVEIIRVGYDADMTGGWTPDGKIVLVAMALRASLSRFRPEGLKLSPHTR
ncbi:MAG: hypothetical protein HYU27_00165 [Acidobacteria bacterium]|nr:hypothetical protein [Acidobacteriota bacterium]